MSKEKSLFRQSVVFSSYIILLLWLVKSIEWAFSANFAHFGIYPRHLLGTIGIFTSPFIHGDFLHLLSNSFSLMLLIIILFFFYDKIALRALLFVYILTGVSVWFIAREAYHIGASGVIYGIASFILFSGLLRKNQSSLALSFVVLLLYGGMFYGVLPQDGHISWESHLMGLLSGLIVAFFLRNEFAGQAELKLHFEEISDEDEFPETEASEFTFTSGPQNYQYQYTPKINPINHASNEADKLQGTKLSEEEEKTAE
ncbi:rhomboid family intramembrane serine protease [Marivirga sp. S37H4]|uniref:Rhomboid family intramembrane serine protease n=1 Tax=Marivirga aurantiaca TaxID=2802615 RepID=A0A934X095_9BACT|nr:rhomboid family intramembrane serine protease [Marivirga aurantiaca]MBK6266284.1 rhomboid family intramembrane serine protease [Marivirga aurantiaca]